ncbi:transposase [Oesophagostomum dentatum]|uniref:Transposase n=1 Tax=Oesophagostomum dentatum TaxID=61180 RepID=A0A0B1TCG7_OESDE|nr:transposase [Oesophagostomum dentatum]
MHTTFGVRERLLYEYQLGPRAALARRNIDAALGHDVLKKSTTGFWFRRFREGCNKVEDNQRSRRLRSVNRASVVEAVKSNSSIATRMLSAEFHCSHTSVEKNLHESGYRVRHGKWVPHDLSAAQKKSRYECALELERRHKNHSFLDRLITCDETWIPLDNRRPSKQWPKVTPKAGLHPNNVMLCVWWWKGGIIHWELAENGHTIDAELYCSQLEHVSEEIREAGLRGLYRKGPILQQDNAGLT